MLAHQFEECFLKLLSVVDHCVTLHKTSVLALTLGSSQCWNWCFLDCGSWRGHPLISLQCPQFWFLVFETSRDSFWMLYNKHFFCMIARFDSPFSAIPSLVPLQSTSHKSGTSIRYGCEKGNGPRSDVVHLLDHRLNLGHHHGCWASKDRPNWCGMVEELTINQSKI